ncbi:hypothetical protein [Haloferax sp. Q22]|uniref:hypothetical protein n=1 Tax=Haloferax sp. (strain Q22) TaxID=1526048 RepID=UPI0012F75C87|nr:hypothetical protein [Haloferax sp. Q22]
MDENISDKITLSQLIYLIAIVISGISIAGFHEYLAVENVLNLISIIVSASLSGALVFLYFQQKQILESQVDLKKAELSGDLYVTDHDYDGNSIDVELSNFSGSEISGLALRTVIFPKNIDGLCIEVSKELLRRADKHGTQFGRETGIAPREQEVTFNAKPSVQYTNTDGNKMRPKLTEFITQMRDRDVEEIQCRMWVEGTDQLEQRVKSKVLTLDRKISINTDGSETNEPTLDQLFHPKVTTHINNIESEY